MTAFRYYRGKFTVRRCVTGRARWEALAPLRSGSWVVAYGPTRWHARRRLVRKIGGRS